MYIQRGDKFEVVGNHSLHCWELGTIVVVVKVKTRDHLICEDEHGNYWHVDPKDLKRVFD